MSKHIVDKLWSHIYWLTILAQQGSFTAAAKHLNVSKAAMSNRMAELERATGIPLIRRTTRSVRLTEAGHRLVDDTSYSFKHLSNSFDNIKELAEVPSGLIRVTAPVAFSRQHLASCLPQFLDKYPQIKIEIDMNDELVSLAVQGYDLAIRHVDTPPDIYVAKTICATRTLLVASPRYLKRNGVPTHPRELSDYRHLIYPRQKRLPTWVFMSENSNDGAVSITVPLHSTVIANNSEMLRGMAIDDAGIALLPDFSAKESIENGELVEILPYWRSVGAFGRKIFALRPYSVHTPRAVRALFAHLTNSFSNGFEIQRS